MPSLQLSRAQAAAGKGLQLGDLPTQTDIKTTWPDGSIRFAVVTAAVPTAGDYDLHEAAPYIGSFTPTMPDAEVRFAMDDGGYIARVPQTPSNDSWLSGPLVSETRSLVAPVAADNAAPHPFLRVLFDVRTYKDGQTRLDVTVENTLDQAGATNVTYTVDIVARGQTLFHRDDVTQYYLTRWRQVFAIGLTASQVTPDFEPFVQAKAVPRYLDSVTNVSPEDGNFDILQNGSAGRSTPRHLQHRGEHADHYARPGLDQ
jgi:hypothetical protein